MKKKAAQHKAAAKLASPVGETGAELVTLTKHQVSTIQLCKDYGNEPAVQAATKLLQDDTVSLEATLSALANTRAALAVLEGTRDTEIVSVLRGRRSVQTTISVVCKGVVDAIKAWGCIEQSQVMAVLTTEAPLNLTAKNSKTTAGTVAAQCKAVRGAVAYQFQVTSDPNALPGAGLVVTQGKAKYTLAGQQSGHVLYVRVAVIRRKGGPSLWSDAVQLTVR